MGGDCRVHKETKDNGGEYCPRGKDAKVKGDYDWKLRE